MLVVNAFIIFCNKIIFHYLTILSINHIISYFYIIKKQLIYIMEQTFTRVGHEKNVKNAAVAQYWNKYQISGPKHVITYEKHNGASAV